jgi:(hydroxyamino)benzene mutase
LIVGVVAPLLANPKLGFLCHVEGVLNGIFLIVLGLIWNIVAESNKCMTITFWLSIYGTFANWLGHMISALFNTGRHLTMATKDQAVPPLADDIVDFLLLSLTMAMFTISITVIIG